MKYLRSLWMSLSIQRAILMTNYGQDPFDKLPDAYKVNLTINEIDVNDLYALPEISDDNSDETKSMINEDDIFDNQLVHIIVGGKMNVLMNLNGISSVLNILYQLIMFQLIPLHNARTVKNEVYAYQNQKLKDCIYELAKNEETNNDKFQIDNFNLDMFTIKNVFHLWNIFVKLYFNKKN